QLNTMEDFQRDISYRVLKRENGTIALTATLQDRFHDIMAEVIVDGETLTITAIKAEFRKSPTGDCRNVSASLERLVGFAIGKGLNRKLMEVLGGGEGCGNMRNLLLGLLPLALNVRASAGIMDEREMLDSIHERLHGTCAGYAAPPERLKKP
ncbi:MAG TPA: DUF2889 domain-containing protein, partial [Geobacteraceae bacterium]|nr:DUF2889 domain-containing protein [Geobacteraceae bacterium]